MKKTIGTIAILGILLGGCATPNSELGWSFIKSTVEPVVATNSSDISKTGEACGSNILGFISFGDFSVDNAKHKGNITEVSSVDSSVMSIMGLYAQKCTIVKGK